jgi:hypothetical protein
LKNAEGSGIGVLLAVADMFCDLQNKQKEGMKVDRGIDTFCLSRAGSIRKRHEYINPKYKSYASIGYRHSFVQFLTLHREVSVSWKHLDRWLEA